MFQYYIGELGHLICLEIAKILTNIYCNISTETVV